MSPMRRGHGPARDDLLRLGQLPGSLFEIRHLTEYRYSEPVLLAPHLVRLRPRSGGDQVVLEFKLRVEPEPRGRAEWQDGEGNPVDQLWFDQPTERLILETTSRVRTLRANPFDYLLPPPRALQLPLHYADYDTALLRAYTARPRPSPQIDSLAAEVAEDSGGFLPEFLARLNRLIFREFRAYVRETGGPLDPAQTLAERAGACRDLSVLFIDACRSQGIAARFVSGYQAPEDEPDAEPQLHAWAEVYVPGGGWRGYDPTHGLAVADRHVALAASIDPEHAAPVTGEFRAPARVTSLLVSRLEVVAEPVGEGVS